MTTREEIRLTRMGYGYSERYGGVDIGTSRTVCDLGFMLNGNLILRLHNIVDPYGLKKLVEGSVKSSTFVLRTT